MSLSLVPPVVAFILATIAFSLAVGMLLSLLRERHKMDLIRRHDNGCSRNNKENPRENH